MTDITRQNAKVDIWGTVACDGANAVAVVIPQMMALEGAAVTGRAANAVAVKTAVSGITLTITPAGNMGAGYYDIHAWGY
jgi:hypothetical protein